MTLKPEETELIGDWVLHDGRMVLDATEQRIDLLISQHLEKVAVSPESGGWDVLYRDPIDGRYWELTYPKGEMHGGGPRRLAHLPP
jgi:hypothetical protein